MEELGKSQFPSPYGVSFILIVKNIRVGEELGKKFPSPCGVSFILIQEDKETLATAYAEFPSPYGVLFILISIAKSNAILKIIWISVFL